MSSKSLNTSSNQSCAANYIRGHDCEMDGCRGDLHRAWRWSNVPQTAACIKAGELGDGGRITRIKRVIPPEPAPNGGEVWGQWEFWYRRLFHRCVLVDQYARVVYRCPHQHREPSASTCGSVRRFMERNKARFLVPNDF